MSRGLRFSITASDRSKAAFSGVQNNIRKTQGLQRSWNAGLNSNRRAVQQFGFQMSDFAIQIAGGQSAMLAFTQQGGQMLQFFGPAGSIMAALLAIFGSLAIAFTRSGKALSDLTPIMGVLGEDFAAIGRVLSAVKEIMIDFANVVLNNMDRIIITVSLLAGLMAGRWVVAFVAARVATFTLVGALTALRAALIRTGIGALIVGAGELVYQFTRLVKGAGSVGDAMGLLWAVVSEVSNRIKLAFQAAWQWVTGVALRSVGAMMDGIADFVESLPSNVINKIIGAFVGAYQAVVAAWDLLPAAFKRIGALAINGIINAVEKGIGGVTDAINGILEAVGLTPIPPPDLSAWKVAEGEAVNMGAAVTDAFSSAMSTDYVGDFTAGIRDASSAISNMGNEAIISSAALADALGRPIQSWEDLKAAINAADEAGKDIDIRDWFGGGSAADAAGGGAGGAGAGGGRGSIADQMSEQAKEIKSIFDDLSKSISGSLSTAFKGLLDRTKSVKDVAVELFSSILNKLTETMLNPLWDQLGTSLTGALIGTPGSTGFSGGLLSGIFSSLFGGASFAGGGNTGKGARSGGLDGRGGKLAMVHPNETILDHTRHQGSEAGGVNMEVHIHENASDGDTRVQQSGGRIDVFLRRMVADTIGDGGADKAINGRFGLRPQAQGA